MHSYCWFVRILRLLLFVEMGIFSLSKVLSRSSTIFISSFSSVNCAKFKEIILSLSNIKEQNDFVEKKKLVYIPTAMYAYNPDGSKPRGEQRRRARYDARQKLQFLEKSFACENQGLLLELDDPKLSKDQLRDSIKAAGIVYVDGGNTFYLQRHVLQSGFMDIVGSYLAENQMVYIGASAGAITSGQSIKTAFSKGWVRLYQCNYYFHPLCLHIHDRTNPTWLEKTTSGQIAV